MKHFPNKVFLIGAFTILCLFATDAFAAGPPNPGGGKGGPPCWPPPCVPIDGGVSFLIAAGVLLGGWKIYSAYKKKLA
jgi:hypothetical protein